MAADVSWARVDLCAGMCWESRNTCPLLPLWELTWLSLVPLNVRMLVPITSGVDPSAAYVMGADAACLRAQPGCDSSDARPLPDPKPARRRPRCCAALARRCCCCCLGIMPRLSSCSARMTLRAASPLNLRAMRGHTVGSSWSSHV